MSFVYAGQVFDDSCGALIPVSGSVAVLAFESGRQIAGPKGLKDSDARFFGDLADQAAKKKNQLSSGNGR